MADPYPSLPQRIGTAKQVSYGTVVDRAETGRPRFRTFYSQGWATFTVFHEGDQSEMQGLLDHYTAHGRTNTAFNFTYSGDGETYKVKYADIPKTQAVAGKWLWVIESTLVQVP